MAVEFTDERDADIVHYLVTDDSGYTFCGFAINDSWDRNDEGDCSGGSTNDWANSAICVVCADLFEHQFHYDS